jgi:chromosome segregation ATPase
MADQNGNGINIGLEVLAERIANLAKKLDEQAASQKEAVDAALITSQTAITVALATQEKTVNAAFAASEKAISKAEESQKEYNKAIGALQNDVVSLKESRSQSSGNSGGIQAMYGYIFGFVVAAAAIAGVVFTALHK